MHRDSAVALRSITRASRMTGYLAERQNAVTPTQQETGICFSFLPLITLFQPHICTYGENIGRHCAEKSIFCPVAPHRAFALLRRTAVADTNKRGTVARLRYCVGKEALRSGFIRKGLGHVRVGENCVASSGESTPTEALLLQHARGALTRARQLQTEVNLANRQRENG